MPRIPKEIVDSLYELYSAYNVEQYEHIIKMIKNMIPVLGDYSCDDQIAMLSIYDSRDVESSEEDSYN